MEHHPQDTAPRTSPITQGQMGTRNDRNNEAWLDGTHFAIKNGTPQSNLSATHCTHDKTVHCRPTNPVSKPPDTNRNDEGPDVKRIRRRCKSHGTHEQVDQTSQTETIHIRTRRKHHTDSAFHTVHKQETHIMDQPTGLIPDRGKKTHTKTNKT